MSRLYYRVVETDNFNGDYPDERFALPYYCTEMQAQKLADLLNELFCNSPYSTRYWKVVDDRYELQPGFEP